MTPRQLFSLIFVFRCFLLPLGAEPLNVLVGDLTFTRPATWKWEAPDPNSPAVTSFVIPNPGSSRKGDVRFYAAGKEAAIAAKQWKGYFEQADQGSFRMETQTIGGRTVSYVFLRGTLTLPRDKALPSHALMAAVIPWGTRFLHIRVTGPTELVENAIPDFKAMVQAAVQDREAETAGN